MGRNALRTTFQDIGDEDGSASVGMTRKMNSIGFNLKMTLSLPWTNGPTVHSRWTRPFTTDSPLDDSVTDALGQVVRYKLGDGGDGVTVRIVHGDTA